MSIPISNYVDITSGIGAATTVPTRNLGALIITGNNLCPTGTILTFTSASAVGEYFGTDSEEYARAVFYFGWISKNITAAQQISFYFWNNDTAVGSLIFGVFSNPETLSGFNAITTGDFTLTLGGFTHHITAVNLSGAGNLAAVATDITAAINAYSAGGAAWTGAVVSYDATTASFNLVSGLAGADTVSVTAGVTEDLAAPLGWLTGAVLSNGQAAQTPSQNLIALGNLSNNFGSFCYTFALAPTLTTITAAANWNNSLTPNVQFIFGINITTANAAAWEAALNLIGGIAPTLQSPGTAATIEFPEMCPMLILAATNYAAVNSAQNYMYQIFALTPSVTTAANQALYDGLGINYYGQTQTAGQLLQFYQRGTMWGLPVNPQDQNIYANEIWFKDALAASLATLLLSLSQIPASNTGVALILSIMQPIINQALANGTIEVGKQLTAAQQLYIAQVTGNPKAWYNVQNIGYIINCVILPYVYDGRTQYKAVYTLVYSKDDTVKFIQGSDILI